MVDGLRQETAGRYDIKELNLSKDPSLEPLANRLKVRYVPTFVFVNSDGSVAKTVVGGITKDSMLAELAKLR